MAVARVLYCLRFGRLNIEVELENSRDIIVLLKASWGFSTYTQRILSDSHSHRHYGSINVASTKLKEEVIAVRTLRVGRSGAAIKTIGKTEKRIVDPQRIFKSAEMFFNAGRALGFAIEQQRLDAVWPACICSSLALELYLKCLLLMDHKKTPPAKHDLKALYDGLSKETKAKIDARFDRKTAQQFIDAAHAVRGAPVSPPVCDVNFELERSRNSFEVLRYIYEHASLPDDANWIAEEVLQAVRKLILDENPLWRNLKPSSGPLPPRSSLRRP